MISQNNPNNFTLQFDDFDDIQGEIQKHIKKQQSAKSNSDEKKNFVMSKSQLMFQAKTMSKGFFTQQNNSYADLMSENQSPNKINNKRQGIQDHDNNVKSRRKKKVDKLQPFNKESQKVQVFKNFQQTNTLYNKRKEKRQSSKSKDQKDQSKKLSIQKKKTQTKLLPLEQNQNVKPLSPPLVKNDTKETTTNNNKTITQQIETQKVAKTNQKSPIAKKRLIFETGEQEVDNDEDDDSPNKLVDETNLQKHIINIMSCPLKPNTVMKMTLQRNASGFNTFWPVFHVTFLEDKSYLMSAKKTSSKPSSTFIMAVSKDNFQQKTDLYLGKVKSNFIGDTLTVYGPGLNPNEAFDLKKRPRQVLATIVYQSSYFQGGKPRDFKVYLKKTKVDYYKEFPQVKLYDDQIPLSLLYQNQANRDKIIVLKNRTPQYREEIKGYMLNFKGRVTKPSIKNFILEDVQKPGADVLIFGKVGDNTFSMDVYHPLSPCIGLGIVLSSFDTRILIE